MIIFVASRCADPRPIFVGTPLAKPLGRVYYEGTFGWQWFAVSHNAGGLRFPIGSPLAKKVKDAEPHGEHRHPITGGTEDAYSADSGQLSHTMLGTNLEVIANRSDKPGI